MRCKQLQSKFKFSFLKLWNFLSSPNVFALQLVESEDVELADMECTA